MLQNITSGDGLGNLIEGLQKKYGVFTRMDFGETQKGLIILENDKYKIEIFKKKGDKMNTNTNTPSKELFIEVTGINECLVDYIQEREGFIKYGNAVYQEVNIYELAHKVKEWAWYDQSYQISSYFITLELKQGMSAEDLRQQPVCQSCIANINGTLIEYFDAKTEPEAIFQAGEWILSQAKLS
jgi:hypothetical protein